MCVYNWTRCMTAEEDTIALSTAEEEAALARVAMKKAAELEAKELKAVRAAVDPTPTPTPKPAMCNMTTNTT